MTSASLHFPGAKVVRFQAGMSPGKCSEPVAVEYSGRPFDIWAVKRVWPDQWRAFIKAHFRSPSHVAYIFGCDEKTARNWWEGSGSPRSEYVIKALEEIPSAAAWLRAA